MDLVSQNTSRVHSNFSEAVVEASSRCATNFEQEPRAERAVDRLMGVFVRGLASFAVVT
ncbi:hypothetical protein [Bradyrhizobium sp. CCGUVB23]|uniref:hypothetical protein n=1 Tax=Bradyrhizobium sp. CCGUVB23 TaxID=2949630 RepID=UPI0020B33884|nr:hypothetical protein [Bradyrhizobium sp. CCGUVB23]MCP3463528.1 hypothetical protein [Bradyrhizobium sp. CCGUVB23]